MVVGGGGAKALGKKEEGMTGSLNLSTREKKAKSFLVGGQAELHSKFPLRNCKARLGLSKVCVWGGGGNLVII